MSTPSSSEPPTGSHAFSDQTDAAPAFGLRAVDEELLRVALGPREHTAAIWSSLRARFPAESLDDPRFYPLRPLVGAALADADVEDSELGRLRGVRRLTFVRQQLLLAELATARGLLDGVGARSVLLGGVPLAHSYYVDASLRPTTAVELLVDPTAVPAIIAAFDGAGWRSAARPAHDVVARFSELRYQSPGERAELLLQWRLAPWLTAVTGDDRASGTSAGDPQLWTDAAPMAIEGTEVLTASPDDLLLHVVTRAYRVGWATEPRWVADLVLLVRGAGPALDWDRLVHRVQRGGLVLPVRDALAYASSLADLPVPASVVRALRGSEARRGVARRYAAGSRPLFDTQQRIPGQNLVVDWHRQTFNLDPDARARRLVPFALGRTGADDVWSVPLVVARHRREHRA